MRRRSLPVSLVWPGLSLLAGCGVHLPSQLPRDARWLVAVKSAPLPSPWFAHHAFVEVLRDGRLQRIESGGRLGLLVGEQAAEELWLDRRFDDRAVRVLGYLEGDAARAAIGALDARLEQADSLQGFGDGYRKWPGPNSNTLVRDLVAGVPGLGFVFDPNCIGKDFAWLDLGWTSSRTGVRLDTPLLGGAVGLREGVELHLLQLTFGVSIDPPGLSLPFLPQIPFGWFGPTLPRLVPPPVEGALRIELEPELCDGVLRPLGTVGTPGLLLAALPDATAWLEVRIGPERATALPSAFDVEFAFRQHAGDGVSSWTRDVRFSAGSHESLRTQCGSRVVHWEVRRRSDGLLEVGCRAFRDLAAEAAAREPIR